MTIGLADIGVIDSIEEISVKEVSNTSTLKNVGKNKKEDMLFFLGAGASIPAGLSGVVALVQEFKNWLQSEGKTNHLEITEKIITTLQKWKDPRRDTTEIDIELLLETIEKIENRNKEVLPLFYEKNTFTLSNCKGYELISDGKMLLSEEVRKFIKSTFTEKKLRIEYLKSLLVFLKDYRPLNVFSTNYDVCLEESCRTFGKECVDGFDPKWNPEVVFNSPRADVRLYKLHGSVTWYRTEEGDYESYNILIKDMKVKLATGQEAVPFIVYPGRKLEYNEPTIDILVELKRQLKSIKYIFVVGYSFKDDHIAKLFRYAAKFNREFILFLISPSAHEIYYSTLKRHKDKEFPHSFTRGSFSGVSFNIDLASDLEERIIRLPYRFEKIVHLLDLYLDNLKTGQHCERERGLEFDDMTDKQIALSRWHECLLPFINCEYIDKVEKIIEEKIGWDELLFNRDYRLGCKIIIKSLLNVLPSEGERVKWLKLLKKYVPISSEKLELHIEKKDVYVLFRFNGQRPLHGDDTLKFYNSLLDVYKDHPIFFNDERWKMIENGEERIKKACDYLDIWKNTTLSLDNYINIRKNKYADKLSTIENLLQNYKDDKTSTDGFHKTEQVLNEIEKEELGHYYN